MEMMMYLDARPCTMEGVFKKSFLIGSANFNLVREISWRISVCCKAAKKTAESIKQTGTTSSVPIWSATLFFLVHNTPPTAIVLLFGYQQDD